MPTAASPLPDQADAPAPAGAEGLARGLIERQLGLLGRLAEAGLNIALAVERQVMAVEQASTESGSPDAGCSEKLQRMQALALAYGRAARAVRLTVALQSRLVKDLQEIDAAAARRRTGAEAAAARERQQRQAARKDQVERLVERMIRAEVGDEAEVDRLAEEAYERLDDDDIYGDLLARPVSEIVALVCKDLGLAPDWGRVAHEAWARETGALETGALEAGAPEEIDGWAAGPPRMTLRWLDPPEPQTAPTDAFRAGPVPRAPQAASP